MTNYLKPQRLLKCIVGILFYLPIFLILVCFVYVLSPFIILVFFLMDDNIYDLIDHIKSTFITFPGKTIKGILKGE